VQPSPLVSIIVRSRGRGGLHAALTSAAAQSYGRIEVVVIDTTGHPDSAWPAIEWRPEHAVHWLANGERMSDARAANLALEAVRGEYFCFLDDNSVFDPRHVDSLVRAAAHHPDALVFYARSRVAGSGAARLIGQPLNRALFFHDQVFCLPSALIRRAVLERGCRFDVALELGAEHDFLEQIALLGNFIFLANAPPTCTSTPDHGDARGGVAQRLYYDNLRFAKWTGERVWHGLRSALLCGRAARRLDAGEAARARAAFESVLTLYPGDPDALHGLARCDLAAGRLESAWQCINEAIGFDPANAEYRRTADAVRQRLARIEPRAAPPAPPTIHFSAPREITVVAAPVVPPAVVLSTQATARSALCPCGSGKRYKHCCGRLEHASSDEATPRLPTPASLVRQARELLQRGAAYESATLLSRVAIPDIGDAQVALDAGHCYLEMHLLQPAFTLFERALELDGSRQDAQAACDECCQLMFRASAWDSAGRTIRAQLERQNASPRAARGARSDVHIVCKLDTVGGTERRALNLYRTLSAHAPVTLWTTAPPLAEYGGTPARLITPTQAPAGGTLILIGTYFPCNDWLESAPFERVVICHNLAEQYPSLMERLIQLSENPARPRVALTFPSQLFCDTSGLPGHVEYSAVDVDAFRRREPRGSHRARLAVGRHGRAYALKFHPNDPAFFRGLIERGYGVRILGGAPIAGAFAPDEAAPELLAIGAETARDFLERLDIFVYRKHPRFFETGGTAILEAMAMELPVVMFREQCGIAELIRDGENGFLVDTESQAIETIDRLALDRDLRLRIGAAARAAVVDLMGEQQPRALSFYLGAGAGANLEGKPGRWWQRWFGAPRGASATQP
jgi:tetratricopeptide (TPR) repeat protein